MCVNICTGSLLPLHFAGSLPHLSSLSLTDNPLTSPPQQVVRQGTKAVLAFLRARWQEEREGESGKSGKGDGVWQQGMSCAEQKLPPYLWYPLLLFQSVQVMNGVDTGCCSA